MSSAHGCEPQTPTNTSRCAAKTSPLHQGLPPPPARHSQHVLPGVAVQRLLQPLLVECVADEADGARQHKEAVQIADLDHLGPLVFVELVCSDAMRGHAAPFHLHAVTQLKPTILMYCWRAPTPNRAHLVHLLLCEGARGRQQVQEQRSDAAVNLQVCGACLFVCCVAACLCTDLRQGRPWYAPRSQSWLF